MNIKCRPSDFGPAKGWFALAAAVPKRSRKTQISLGFYSYTAPTACHYWDGRELVALIKFAMSIGDKDFVNAPNRTLRNWFISCPGALAGTARNVPTRTSQRCCVTCNLSTFSKHM